MKYKAPPRESLMTAVVAVQDGQTLRFLKYRRIRNDPETLRRFENFIRKDHPAAQHVNYYGGISRGFVKQNKL
jgi:hypothetical protein